jgi:hypothetical protein
VMIQILSRAEKCTRIYLVRLPHLNILKRVFGRRGAVPILPLPYATIRR